MDEKQCPFCAETIKDQAIRCKHCHADLADSTDSIAIAADPKQVGFFAKALIVVVFAVAGIIGLVAVSRPSSEDQAKDQAQRAIDMCHSNERAFSGSTGARAIITGACQKLDDDFRARYGHAL